MNQIQQQQNVRNKGNKENKWFNYKEGAMQGYEGQGRTKYNTG